MEAETRANQLLAQIATLTGVDLGARIIEELIFDEGAELGIPIVIRAREYLPGQIGMACASAGAKTAARCAEVETRGFRIVTMRNPRVSTSAHRAAVLAPAEAQAMPIWPGRYSRARITIGIPSSAPSSNISSSIIRAPRSTPVRVAIWASN